MQLHNTQDSRTTLIIERLKWAFPPQRPLALHEPSFDCEASRFVQDCIESGWVSSVGAYVDRFEQALVDYTGVSRAVATVNGTAALHTCLRLVDTQPGDEVLVPALTFVATANAVVYCGATPNFVDVSPSNLGVDARRLGEYLADIAERREDGCFNTRTGRRLRALIVVHSFGHPAAIDELRELCDEYGLWLIEDAAESLGSRYRDRHTGCFGHLAAVSFNGNKILTTGGGGAILTQDHGLADRAKHLTTTAKVPHAWRFDHDELGYNYRMPNLNAALGLAQMEHLENTIQKKRHLAQAYHRLFRDVPGVRVFCEQEVARSNYWLNLLILPSTEPRLLDELLQAAHGLGFQLRPAWTPMHRLPMYRFSPRMDLSETERLVASLICLPSSPGLELSDG